MTRKRPLPNMSILGNKNKMVAIIIITIVVVSIFGYILAFKKVDATNYGLDKNLWTGKVNTGKVYDPGRHRIGILHTFITFPSIQQSIEFAIIRGDAINGRTSDGLLISLDISFQYQLSKEDVGKIYENFGNKYEDIIVKQARDVIRDVSSKFNAITFFNNRTTIGFEMEGDLRLIIDTEVFVEIKSFQLRAVDLPDAFENALERAEVARQEIEIAQFEQQSAFIRANTAIIQAEAQANITILEAVAEAEAFLINIDAQAEALNITLTAESEGYYALAQALNLTSGELLAFLWIQALTEIGEFGNLIIIGDNTPEIILDTSNATMT